MTPTHRVLAVVGLRVEARILARHGIEAVVGGGDAARLAGELAKALSRPPPGCSGVLSFGVAGGLSPGLGAGGVVIATRVLDLGRCSGAPLAYEADAGWVARLRIAFPRAQSGALAGVGAPVATVSGKAALFAATGALAADMESHLAAEAAARHGLPFAAVRVISDRAADALPRAALSGMRPDGGTDAGAVIAALLRRPHELPALLRTATDFRLALKRLGKIDGPSLLP